MLTTTTVLAGMVDGGCELLPGSDVEVGTPPVGILQLRAGALSMEPFMDAGALFTSLNWLVFQSWEPQKLSWTPLVGALAEMSPITNAPASGGAAVVSEPEALEGR